MSSIAPYFKMSIFRIYLARYLLKYGEKINEINIFVT